MNADFRATFDRRIEALAALSESPDYLMRPSFTPAMKGASALVAGWMRDAEMAVREDGAGNLIGRYEGATTDCRTLVIGSHIDTVIDAGKYDGTLGVLLGIACVEALASEGRRLPFAIEVVAFADEEGLRFGLPYIGSRALVGALDDEDLLRCDGAGVPLREAIAAYHGNPAPAVPLTPRRADDLLGYLEVHIEQGPVLEALGIPVGVVTAISGQSRLEIGFTGAAGHAGTVPMDLRRDALVAAARFVVAVQETARAVDGLVATVGQIAALPGASNAIPGRAVLSLDIRHMAVEPRRAALDQLYLQAQQIAAAERVELDWRLIADFAPIPCAPQMIGVLGDAVREAGVAPRLMPSGAGHDAAMMSRVTPVGMLFVRCREGISHNPAEFCEAADAEFAAGVLMSAVERLAAQAG